MTEPVAVSETHSAVVLFWDDRAYKVKKPLDLGFVDHRSREAREATCRREVELNRRLAPDVYLGVLDVLDPAGQLADHVVAMRRMPTDRRLSTLVAHGGGEGHVRRVARVVAGFHAAAERGPAVDATAAPEALARRWADNTAEMEPFTGGLLDGTDVAAVDALAHRYLEGRHALIDHRIAEGRACDGHGDLLADDIFCLDDGPRILDCLEFDDRLRYEDVLADVAFLAMDLERLGRVDLAGLFLTTYQEHADDHWPASLEHHHIAYRAQVRAKVAAIRAGQGHEGSVAEASHLLGICRRHLEAGRVRLVVVGGLPGTGKSTLAAGLGDSLGAVVVRSDEIRKELAGLRPDEPAPASFGEGLYGDETTEATYRELLRRAETGLTMGESVVVDASWTDASRRARARDVAERTAADLVELRCVAPTEVAEARLRARVARGGDASDADPGVAAALAARADAWPEAVDVGTVGPPDALLAMARAVVVAG